ncbi:gluconolactonase [Paenibacillus sp. 1_12]|uniref:SMP-30/gluconolactonase/LRE family protein n=1 Tax=Paenibacillus sp. 1_12 TaxID=1566278 RepID=UPI0008E6530E|nr:SMP-30/gluconolactonase/LRE family protein [Paenibacillus sp. 1_12]SFK95608.1 gluconolactonase [Paenibacillus sp. 1_12]
MELVVFSDKIFEIIDKDYVVEQLVSGLVFTEGPIWDKTTQSVLFTDFTPNRIYKWNRAEGCSVYREESGRAVGLTMDRAGRVVSCETSKRRVSRIEENGEATTLASHYEGKRLNSPNDVIVKSDGMVYFTDPYSTAMGDTKELSGNGIYKVSPETGEITLLGMFNRPNGLAFSPDEKLFYMDDTNLQHVEVFDVTEDGLITNGRVFATLDTDEGRGAADGMKVDSLGNVYVTGPGGVWVIAPDGEKLGIFKFPEVAANLCWGGDDWKTLYVTATSSLYSLQLNIPGIPIGKGLDEI